MCLLIDYKRWLHKTNRSLPSEPKYAADIVTDTLYLLKDNELFQLRENAIFRSGQGLQYASEEVKKLLEKEEMVQSMSRRENCWDNAPQESFWGHMKD